MQVVVVVAVVAVVEAVVAVARYYDWAEKAMVSQWSRKLVKTYWNSAVFYTELLNKVCANQKTFFITTSVYLLNFFRK